MTGRRNYSPQETEEQVNFVAWLEGSDLKFTAIPNSTYTPYKTVRNKNHIQGVRAGFPDLVILIPPERSRDGEGYFICIEMKRQQGGQVRPAQKEWQEAINNLGSHNVQAYVCKGAAEAIDVIRHYALPKTGLVF